MVPRNNTNPNNRCSPMPRNRPQEGTRQTAAAKNAAAHALFVPRKGALQGEKKGPPCVDLEVFTAR